MATNPIAPIEIEGMSTEQAGRITDRFQTRCRKEGNTLPKPIVQIILEDEGDVLAQEMFEVLRKRVERRANIIVRRVKVDRTRTTKEALTATGRKQYVTDEVVITMPKGNGEEVELHFFKPNLSERGGYISDDDLKKEFELRNLDPADPISIAAFNEADPVFADEKPHGTHWKNAEGKWRYAAFSRWGGERRVHVDQDGNGWHDYWWFVGVRKSPKPSAA